LCAILVAAGFGVYCNSLVAVFVFDDLYYIVNDPRIHQLWPPDWLADSTRPVHSFLLAFNYAAVGERPWFYHLTSIVVHLLASLALFGVVHRTLKLEPLSACYHRTAPWLAFSVSLLWMLHPLHTQSVTYTWQRSEALAGMFYLTTLYAVIRGACSSSSRGWYLGATTACALGMMSKETAVTAPLVVLLYDRTFLSGSFRKAIRQRRHLYAGLAATWGVLAVLLLCFGAKYHSHPGVGFDSTKFTIFEYCRTMPGALSHYLKLSFWPNSLCLDYAWPRAETVRQALPAALVVGGLLAMTLWALVFRPGWGFVGAWFFVTIAPVSSIMPMPDPVVEHRMYIPLAALVALVVFFGFDVLVVRLSALLTAAPPEASRPRRAGRVCAAFLVMAAATALGWRTVRRNLDYRSAETVWSSVVRQQPRNARAHVHLALALSHRGELDGAFSMLERAIELGGFNHRAYKEMGVIRLAQGRHEDALSYFRNALALKPRYGRLHFHMGTAFSEMNLRTHAVTHFRQAALLDPGFPAAHFKLGVELLAAGQDLEATRSFLTALNLEPDVANTWYNLGHALERLDRLKNAKAAFVQALKLNPGDAPTHCHLGIVMLRSGDYAGAADHFRKAIASRPDYVAAHGNLAAAYEGLGETGKAHQCYLNGIRINPDDAKLRYLFGNALSRSGSPAESEKQFREALRIDPQFAEARSQLKQARERLDTGVAE